MILWFQSQVLSLLQQGMMFIWLIMAPLRVKKMIKKGLFLVARSDFQSNPIRIEA